MLSYVIASVCVFGYNGVDHVSFLLKKQCISAGIASTGIARGGNAFFKKMIDFNL